jgi:15-cis-phytoene synthase
MSVPESHSPRYFAWLYSLPPQRLVLQSLFGIEREVSESLRSGLDHQVAHSRLQWWREECERAASGSPVHPLTRELVAALDALPNRNPARLVGLTGFVDTTIWDLAGATFESRKELTAYCERWASALIEPLVIAPPPTPPPAAASTGPATSALPSDWCRLGAAMREVEMLTDLAREARLGRLRIPLDELESAGADPDMLAKPPWPDSVAGLLRERYEQLRAVLTRGVGTLTPAEQLACRGLLVWAALAARFAQSAAKALPNPLQPARFGAIADAWFAWQSARRATTGRFVSN